MIGCNVKKNHMSISIKPPYLLFLGDVSDARYAKTASGIHYWAKDKCFAQLRLPGCTADLGLPDLTPGEAAQKGVKTMIVGLAPSGGEIPDEWMPVFEDALKAGLDIASGMHTHLGTIPVLLELARQNRRNIWDVRTHAGENVVASGAKRIGKRLLTVGTDCGVGKMFASLAIQKEMLARGIDVDFRATGQTGMLIAGSGVCIDAIIADFMAGTAELLSPNNDPEHWDIIEGQGSLYHPSYAGVSLALLHGSQPDYLVICHDASRTMMVGIENYPVPGIERVIEANLNAARLVNPDVKVAGISVNTSAMSESEAKDWIESAEQKFQVPVVDLVRTSAEKIVLNIIETCPA